MIEEDFLSLIDDRSAREEVGAEELVEASLGRIAAVDPAINAFISVRADAALEEAREIDARRARGESVGALAGLPLAVKDNIDVGGTRATAGSAFLAERIAESDAAVVQRVRSAGAVIVGKTNLHEFAYGVTTNNPHYGPGRNPWDTSRIPGGSSGGSGAALGADACLLALGTDTGGSVRIPAALNGVSALRPTFGSVSVRGTLPVSASLDTVGPMARSALDVAALHSIIAGYDRLDPWAVEPPARDGSREPGDRIEGLRIAVLGGFFADEVDTDVQAAVQDATEVLEDLGGELVELEIPGAADAVERANRLIQAEALSVHLERLESEPERFGEDVRRRLELGLEISGVEAAQAIAAMRAWRAQMLARFAEIDLIATPTTSETAPTIAGSEMITTTARLTRFTYPWSLAGLPAISIPCGLDSAGMPIGMQLVAAPWRDDTLLATAIAFQRVTDWHRRRPELGDLT